MRTMGGQADFTLFFREMAGKFFNDVIFPWNASSYT
jgi:hypothetical protein